MLVLDGCFILQLFREKYRPQIEWIRQDDILYDLLLFENQLPFFILLKLYKIIMKAGQRQTKKELYDSAFRYFQGRVLNQNITACTGDINRYHYDHLLGLVYNSWLHPHEAEEKEERPDEIVDKEEKEEEYEAKMKKLIDEIVGEEEKISCWSFQNQKSRSIIEDKGSKKFISCATDLEKAGINCKKQKRKKKVGPSLLDIEFAEDAKELKIPKLVIDDNTESILRNMMAYEQSIVSVQRPTLVCNYVSFMDRLIDSGKDVQLLREAEIIENWLGDDEVVAKMFNHLVDFIYLSNDCCYEKTAQKVKKHCRKRRKRWYRWLAELLRDYFKSPWSIISILAAVLLLTLTVAQTIFSVLSYVHRD